MLEFFTYLWFIWIGSIFWVIIKHFLDKDKIKQEREYLFNKEELLFYRWMAEAIIQKLMLLESHRELFLIYLKNSCEAFNDKNSIFIDFNDTFNKEKFETNQEQITSMIFMYFQDLWPDWNECMDMMSKLMNLILKLSFEIKNISPSDLQDIVDEFNKINAKSFWDKPHELSKKIRHIVNEKELILK